MAYILPIHAVFPLPAALYVCFGFSNLEAGLIICITAVLLGGLLTASQPCAVRFHENWICSQHKIFLSSILRFINSELLNLTLATETQEN